MTSHYDLPITYKPSVFSILLMAFYEHRLRMAMEANSLHYNPVQQNSVTLPIKEHWSVV